jgi:hypothetical protein
MTSNESQLPEVSLPDELVRCRLHCYQVKRLPLDHGFRLPLITSLVLGIRGVRAWHYAHYLQEVPVALLGKIYDLDHHEVLEPQAGTNYIIEMPRSLAKKKGFDING